jgi:hypothetical protein
MEHLLKVFFKKITFNLNYIADVGKLASQKELETAFPVPSIKSICS